jgi:hypothetical protein
LDVLTYSRGLEALKLVLEDEEVEKIVWDGRRLVSELWYGHEICVRGVVDLQLVQVYETLAGGRMGQGVRGAVKVEDLESVFSGGLDENTRNDLGVDIKRMELSSSPPRRVQMIVVTDGP